MLIDKTKCVNCGQCIPFCPMACIQKKDGIVQIDLDECVECEACRNARVCPRILRSQFSNPLITHPKTGVPGRGTEEMKTNDVTGRFKRGRAGVCIELGRPGTGTRLKDVQTVAMAVAPYAKYGFEPHNPVTALMVDATGKLREDVLQEKTLSAIVEIEVDQKDIGAVLDAISKVQKDVDTVFSVDFAGRLERDESFPAKIVAQKAGYKLSPNGKTNVGLGKPLAKEE